MNFIRRKLYRREREMAEKEERGNVDESRSQVQIDPFTSQPYKAWKRLKPQCVVKKLEPMPSSSPISKNSIRFVCVADTHVKPERQDKKVEDLIPPGDVLLHAGDFSMNGSKGELIQFNSYFGRLKHKVKIAIAGNHDLTLDMYASSKEEAEYHRNLLTNFIYLEDAMLEICGVKVYGSPWVPVCGSWGFTLPRGAQLLRYWNMIPEDVDILMTHGPPLGYGDTVFDGYPAGCAELLHTVRQRVKPKYHVYGHIHEGYGMYTDEQTVFINAAMCTKRYRPLNRPIVFDYPLPPGHSKRELDDVLSSLKRFQIDVTDTVTDASGQVHKAEDFMKYESENGEIEIEEEIIEDDDHIEFSHGK